MSKHDKRVDTPREVQLDLFRQPKQPPEEQSEEPGFLDCGSRIRAILKQSIKRSPKSRHQVAATMSDALDCDISKCMLDAWTAPSHEGHRFPAEYVIAFVKACGNCLLIEELARLCGGRFVPGPELAAYEIGRLSAEESRIREEKRKLLSSVKTKWRGMDS